MRRGALALTAAQRAELVQVRDRDRRAYLREWATALLKIADGQPAWAMARTGWHRPRQPDTVYRWWAAYQRNGVAALVQRPRGHRVFSLSRGARCCSRAPERFGLDRSRWRLADLRHAVPWAAHYSLAGLGRALQRLGGAPNVAA